MGSPGRLVGPMIEAEDPPYTVPDMPYVIGIGGNVLHAVTQANADWPVGNDADPDRGQRGGAECGQSVVIARRWGEFRRGNEHLATHQLCAHCAWTVALAQDRIGEELVAIAPTTAEEPAWLQVPDPTLFIRICAWILDDREQEREYDADHPRWAQHLGHVTAHRPTVLVPHDCAGGDCDHDDPAGCLAVAVSLACQTCSLQAGSWAGEWEGMYEVTVSAPCSVLTTMAEQFGVATPATTDLSPFTPQGETS